MIKNIYLAPEFLGSIRPILTTSSIKIKKIVSLVRTSQYYGSEIEGWRHVPNWKNDMMQHDLSHANQYWQSSRNGNGSHVPYLFLGLPFGFGQKLNRLITPIVLVLGTNFSDAHWLFAMEH